MTSTVVAANGIQSVTILISSIVCNGDIINSTSNHYCTLPIDWPSLLPEMTINGGCIKVSEMCGDEGEEQ